mgnify:CR=1 FL=1
MRYLAGLAILALFNTLGAVLAESCKLPLPGALVGLILLLVVLLTAGRGWLTTVGRVAEPLISHLSLLFIAPTIAAFYLSQSLQSQLPVIVAILFISTAAAMALLALLIRWLTERRPEP